MSRYYYTDIYESDAKPICEGFKFAFDLARRSESEQLIILAQNRAGLDGAFEECFGKLAKKIVKNSELIIEGVKILFTTVGSKVSREKGVLFCLEVDMDAVMSFEKTHKYSNIVYCPLHKTEADEYAEKYKGARKL